MPSLEQFSSHFFQQRQMARTLLLGGVLSFIPIVNLLALGYVTRTARRLAAGDANLPEWGNLKALALDGLRSFVLLVIYGGIPVLAGCVLMRTVGWLTFSSIGYVPVIFLTAGLWLGTLLWVCALYQSLQRSDWHVVTEWRSILTQAGSSARALALPIFAFWGVILLGFPLYGFASFAGLLLLTGYSVLSLRQLD